MFLVLRLDDLLFEGCVWAMNGFARLSMALNGFSPSLTRVDRVYVHHSRCDTWQESRLPRQDLVSWLESKLSLVTTVLLVKTLCANHV